MLAQCLTCPNRRGAEPALEVADGGGRLAPKLPPCLPRRLEERRAFGGGGALGGCRLPLGGGGAGGRAGRGGRAAFLRARWRRRRRARPLVAPEDVCRAAPEGGPAAGAKVVGA